MIKRLKQFFCRHTVTELVFVGKTMNDGDIVRITLAECKECGKVMRRYEKQAKFTGNKQNHDFNDINTYYGGRNPLD